MKTKFLLIMLTLGLVLLSSCAPHLTESQDTTAQTSQDTIVQVDETVAQTTADTQLNDTEIQTEADTTPTIPVTNGTFSTDTHAVTQVDGKYYLNFVDGNSFSNGSSVDYSGEEGFYLSSVGELRDKLIHNTFETKERNIIKMGFQKDEKGIEIFNVDKMYEAVCPEGMSAGPVYWTGDTYAIYVKAQADNALGKSLDGYVEILPRDVYENLLDKNFKNYFSNIQYEQIISQENGTWEGLSCEVYVYTTSVAKIKQVFIEVPVDHAGQIRYIVIDYVLSSSGGVLPVSDTIPLSVTLYGEYEGQGFELYLSPFETAPTLDFLTSFGITPYVEDTETPAPLDTVSQEAEVK